MTEGNRSLMDFVDAPVVVGDPDGRAVYANPAFQRRFGATKQLVLGEPLANLFEGGAREAVLRAVAQVVEGAPRARLRLKEGGVGYVALASPVEVENGRVGVVILLTEEPPADDRLVAFRRAIQEPLDDLTSHLAAFADQTGGQRDDQYRLRIADSVRAVEQMRKWSDEVETELKGSKGR